LTGWLSNLGFTETNSLTICPMPVTQVDSVMTSVAIVGAGLSGLTLARSLGDRFEVQLFEKSAKPGGRIASRATSKTTFDHGAQFFSVKSPSFSRFISPMIKSGVIADWPARFVELDGGRVTSKRKWTSEFPHYVGYPSMAAIGKWLSTGMNIHYHCHIKRLIQENHKWHLLDAEGELSEAFDWVILALPVNQASVLLPSTVNFQATTSQIKMLPCYALMVTLSHAPKLNFDAALVKNSTISWISVNHSKPGRNGYGLVIHASNAWATENISKPLCEVTASMLHTLFKLTGISPEIVLETDIKRWFFANIAKQDGQPYFIDLEKQVAACGDWCIAGRVEAAFTSASLLADSLTEKYGDNGSALY